LHLLKQPQSDQVSMKAHSLPL